MTKKPYPEIACIASGPTAYELKAGSGPMGVLLATTVSTREQVLDSYGFIFPPANADYAWIVDNKRLNFDIDFPPLMVARNPGQVSRYDRDGFCIPTLKVAVSKSYLESLAEEFYNVWRLDFAPNLYPAVPDLLRAIRRFLFEAGRDSGESRILTENLIPLITIGLLRACLPVRTQYVPGRVRHSGVLRARKLIQDNYSAPLSIQDLAATACLSQSRFMILFRQATGQSPHKYLRTVRIQAAMRLLAKGADVTKACFTVGFNSMSGFEEAFRDLVGSTPVEYRRGARSS
jgi:AraC-like DNA-binding protein